ncbi:cyclin-dependent kinase G-2-like [Neltuma alba]|uniref:cyclin-dependent kinase G-2-like n=1 Tax=Neltuma alba TaxID=207710 RepID=UPI0010A4DDFC|nr:cyclin-dependent kinase G-2-like [Prosopis alba]
MTSGGLRIFSIAFILRFLTLLCFFLSLFFDFCAAARRDNVLRKRESYKYSSIKEFDNYINGSSGAAVHRSSSRHHVTHKNGRRSSDRDDSGPGRTESYGKKEQSEQGKLHGDNGKYAPASVFQEDCGEVVDAETHAPPGKRRKISPIVWNLAEKEVKISDNRTAQATALSPFCPSRQSSHGITGLFYGGAVNSESPADSSSALPQGRSDNEGEYVDQSDKKHVQGWNITMSRWLSDDYSPPNASDDDYMDGKETSSPESGEFICESSEGKKSISSRNSAGVDCCCTSSNKEVNSSEKELLLDTMDDDEEDSETSNVTHPSSDPEDGGSLIVVPRNINSIQSCRSVLEFEMIKKINEGTYGIVYKAKDKKTGEIVALKKVKMNMDRDGFPLSSLREINILSSFNHPSIVEVKEVVVDDFDGVFMVMEYMEYDLKGLIQKMKRPFSIGEVKSLMMKLLKGVKYLHDNWVLHRDLKTSNILLNKEGELRICDFGLSRHYGSPLKPYTPLVVTLWYRAPELLLGAKEYSTAIDMWSIGCIMAELVAKSPLFQGKSEIEQLNNIFQTLGTPNEKIWPGVSKLSGFKPNFVKQPHNLLRKKFPAASFIGSPVLSELGFDLLSKLLTYDPEKRISAEAALLHDWFREAPLPKSDFNITLPSQHC